MAKKNGEVTLRLLEKFLMPIVATAASAAASYAAKKAPKLLGAAGTARTPATGSNGHRRISAEELDRRRDQRAQGRADRRKAVR
jgi:hypothetical protein